MSDTNEVRRGPGRPPNPPAVSAVAPRTEAVSELPTPRRERKPFGTMEQKLAYPKREGYYRHWFVDRPGRIERALEAGYDHVKDSEGKNVCRVTGTAEGGGAQVSYIMEIPEEWYREDMKAQQKLVDEREAVIKRGENDRQSGDGRYVPKNADGTPRIKIEHR